MRRRLLIMRHAESASGSGSDHARALTDAGHRRAHEVALALLERGWAPRAIVSSDARRTVDTWQAMVGALGATALDPRWSRSLYLGGHNEVVDEVARLEPRIPSVLVLGHNPGLSSCASRLCGVYVQLSPAQVVVLETDADSWTEALTGSWRLMEVI